MTNRYAVDGVAPVAVLSPSDEDELCRIVESANEDRTPLVPWGGGTRVHLGNVPADRPAVVDMSNLNAVVSHNYADLTASFQAGATFGFVSEVLAQHGQMIAIDPPVPGSATLGGTLAAGVSGPLKWHFGHPRDTVIGMKVVQPDGRVTKSGGQVVKNVSGYDMSRLHIGALGSLGVILEAGFKLTPLPMYEKTILATFDSVHAAMDAAMRVFNSHVMPLALTAFDGRVARAVELEPSGDSFHLAVRLGGRPRSLDRQVDEVTAMCRAASPSALESQEAQAATLWRALSDFGWLPEEPPLLNVRATALPSDVGRVIEIMRETRIAGLEASVVAHPGFGAVEANWFPEGDAPPTDALADAIRGVRAQMSQIGGGAIVQRCPVEVKRSIDVWDGDPAGIEVMRRLKRQYDPNRIMNPGRFVGGI